MKPATIVCLITVCLMSARAETDVISYLTEYGYLFPEGHHESYNTQQLRRALRQFQRENNLAVNGRITPEVTDFIRSENDKQMVVEYLKSFGYIVGPATPLKTTSAIKQLQRNSGVLAVTGVIDSETINFVKTHPRGYSEGLFS